MKTITRVSNGPIIVFYRITMNTTITTSRYISPTEEREAYWREAVQQQLLFVAAQLASYKEEVAASRARMEHLLAE